MNKNLKDEITKILDKSGLVDIHLAQGLIIQPIIEYIESKLPKKKPTDTNNKYINEDNKVFNGAVKQAREELGYE